MSARETVITYPSHDKTSSIHALLWDAEGMRPRGIIQIIHGASEHCERYRSFAGYLVDRGFVVCANDHIGHGKSAADRSKLGYMPAKTGKEALIQDVGTLRGLVSERYPGLPHIMLGHSMGSFILRVYLSRYGEGLAAVILSGTGQQPRALSAFGNLLARLLSAIRGDGYKSNLLHNLGMGALSKSIPNARTQFDWICTDPAVVDAYVNDEACGMMFSVGAYVALTGLTGEMISPRCAQAVPQGLPILLIAGTEDPVGEKGRAVKVVYEQYLAARCTRVALRLYEGLRHEVLNEPARETVYTDILNWLELWLSR